ncbi:MAG: acyl-CoA dehydrogenase protein [Frankiales bacterium]|nr:acyl-CoA dehydrogenase protein [Frankiales bacterium]
MSAPEQAVSAPEVEQFRAAARDWLSANAERKPTGRQAWGVGSDDVSVFHDLSTDAERALLDSVRAWQARKHEAGYGALGWPVEDGGRGLDAAFEEAFLEEESAYAVPPSHELFSVTLHLVAPTIRLLGTPEQKQRFLPSFLRGEELACQLFSEPGAGSDLAGLGTRAVRDGDEWVVTGQKVWSSGAHFAGWGELLARTDPDEVKHRGITAFLLPLDAPGVEVRPLRQMSGGASFCEVFLDEVRIPDSLRLGDVGAGWGVAMTTLGFERGASSRPPGIGGSWAQLLGLAQWLGVTDDPVLRQRLSRVYAHQRVGDLHDLRDRAALDSGRAPGPEGSLRKLHWVQGLRLISETVAALLGPRLAADTGEWGTFAWTEHVLGAPGYRIAGGSDEVQRSIIAERLLGLPGDPRVDRGVPWRDVPR